MFVWQKDVPKAWADDLATYSPPNPRIPYLWLTWLPGLPPDTNHRFDGDPIQRWGLYQITPNLDVVPLELLDELKGPHPATVGHWHEREPDGPQVWVSDSLVSRKQWELYRETGGYPSLFWIIQGDQGGHAWQLDPAEESFLHALGREATTPRPGALPYAEYDTRVRAKILERDRLQRWRHGQDWDARMNRTDAGLWVAKDREETREQYAQAMLRYLDGQIEDAVREIPHKYLPEFKDAILAGGVVDPDDPLGDSDSLDAAYVEAVRST